MCSLSLLARHLPDVYFLRFRYPFIHMQPFIIWFVILFLPLMVLTNTSFSSWWKFRLDWVLFHILKPNWLAESWMRIYLTLRLVFLLYLLHYFFLKIFITLWGFPFSCRLSICIFFNSTFLLVGVVHLLVIISSLIFPIWYSLRYTNSWEMHCLFFTMLFHLIYKFLAPCSCFLFFGDWLFGADLLSFFHS